MSDDVLTYKGLTRYYKLFFFNGHFFLGFSYKTCNIQVLWIIVKGSDQNNKVEGRRRDSWRRLSIFFLVPEKGKKKVEGRRRDSWRRLLIFFLLPEKGKKKVEGRSHDSWRRLSIFFLLPEKGKKKVEGCRRDSWRQPKNSCCRITRKLKGCRLEFRRQPSTFCLDNFP